MEQKAAYHLALYCLRMACIACVYKRQTGAMLLLTGQRGKGTKLL